MREIFTAVMAKNLELMAICCSHMHTSRRGWVCVFLWDRQPSPYYGSWQFSGIVTQGQTAKNRRWCTTPAVAVREEGSTWRTAKTTSVALDLGQRQGKSRQSGECYRRLGDSSAGAACTSPLLAPCLSPAHTCTAMTGKETQSMRRGTDRAGIVKGSKEK